MKALFLIVFFVGAIWVMVANAGWLLVLIIAGPVLIFTVLPMLFGSRIGSDGNNNNGCDHGYRYTYDATYGATNNSKNSGDE